MDSARQARHMAEQLARRDPALAARIRELAAARGLSMEQWLAEALAHVQGGAALNEADQAALAQVAMQLQALLAASDEQAPAGARNGAEETMEQELASIVHRLQSREEAIEGQLKRLAEHLQQLTGQLQNLQVPAGDGGSMARVEEALAQMVQHMERAEVRMAEAIGDLNERIDEVAARANEALKLSSEHEQLRPWLERLEALEEKLKALQEAPPDLPLQELVAGMEQVQRISEELPVRAEQAAQAAAQQMLGEVEARLEALSGGLQQIDRLGRELARLDEEIATLGQQLAQMQQQAPAAGGASAEDMAAVHEALELIAEKLEHKADRTEVEALAARLEEFSAQLAAAPAAGGGDEERLQAIEQQVFKLKDLLRQAVEEPLAVATERLAAHEERFAALEAGLGRIDGIEQALAQLQQALREEQAAAAAPGEEIAALHKGLEEVRALAERTEGESRAMLEEVQQTLQLIVERLEKVEARPPADDPAAPLLGEEAPAAAAASSGKEGGAAMAIDPQEVAATVAALSGAAADAEQASANTPVANAPDANAPDANAPDASAPDASVSDGSASGTPRSQQMDFIAAARRAALSASDGEPAAPRRGTGLLARLKAMARRRGSEREQASAATSQVRAAVQTEEQRGGLAQRMAALRPLRRAAADADAQAGAGDAGNAAAGRRRLLLAGVVLLSAVALYLSQGGKAPSPAQKPEQVSALKMPAKAQPQLPPSHAAASASANGEQQMGMAVPQQLTTASVAPLAEGAPASAALPQPPALDEPDTAQGKATASAAIGPQAHEERAQAEPAALPPQLGTPALRMAAAQGDARAQMLVAMHYLRGDGVKRDTKAAARWMEKAAKKGLTVAQYRLGTMYEKGIGVARDAARAAHWYERAALAGNVKAMHNLAVLHASGALGKKDYERAAHWFERAARHGLRDSQFNLAVLHHRGLGVKRDLAKAWFWYELAARQGDEAARAQAAQLAEYLGSDKLAAHRRKLAAFKPAPVVRNANVVVIDHPEWRRDATATAAVDAAAAAGDDGRKPLSGKALVRRVQQLLSQLGYDVGPIDGVLGNRTANAIRLFQLQRRLPVSGRPDARLLAELERAAQGRV